jgi:predicted aspartyl protease
MGLTYIEATVTGNTGISKDISLFVDSGASYSLLPLKVWSELKLKPKREIGFILADGSKISRNVSECHFIINNTDAHSPVILGEEGDEALLGVITLENMGLVLDPFKRTLRNMQMRLN